MKVTAEDNGERRIGDTVQIEVWNGVTDAVNGPPSPEHLARGVLGGGYIGIHP